MLLGGDLFKDQVLLGEIIWQNWNVLVIFGLKGELFRNDVLFGKIEGTNWPIGVTGEKIGRLLVTLLKTLLHRALPQGEAIEELFANLFLILNWVFFVGDSDFFCTPILISLDFLS